MKIIISFSDGTSESIEYKEAEPNIDSESHSKIILINKILEKANKSWSDIERVKEIK